MKHITIAGTGYVTGVEVGGAMKNVMAIAQQHQLDLPIVQAVYQVVTSALSPKAAVAQLLAREPGVE